MKIYAAPLEGLTGWQFRQVHRKYFSGVDRYFAPFLTPGQGGSRPTRTAMGDLLPERNDLETTVPQLLTNSAENFVHGAHQLADLGYREVNLNLGCPSGTVTAKGKGSGMLRDVDALDEFLGEIFEKSPLPISVKTRIGSLDPDEFPALLEVYARYPIKELTVHPRVRAEFYKGHVHLDAFALAAERDCWPLCYNGDLKTVADMEAISARFPKVEAQMLGRGLMADPALAQKAKGGSGVSREILQKFSDELFALYTESFGSAGNAMMRMKELWGFLIARFADRARLEKAMKKARTPAEFQTAVRAVLETLPMLPLGWGLPLPKRRRPLDGVAVVLSEAVRWRLKFLAHREPKIFRQGQALALRTFTKSSHL